MKLAVLSDIHGNAVALDAVLADLARDPADAVICLGDCVQGGAQPAEVVERLRELACPVVMGNADAFVLAEAGPETGSAPSPERRILNEVRDWSRSRLSAADRDFITAFTPTVAANVGGRVVLGFHGSPSSYDDILLPATPREEFERLLSPHATDLMCGGHVHLQFQRRLGDSVHFNPGSVGQAYRHDQPPGVPCVDPWAEYAVVHCEGGRFALEFRRLPYDVTGWFRVLRESGRPHAEDAIAQFRARE